MRKAYLLRDFQETDILQVRHTRFDRTSRALTRAMLRGLVLLAVTALLSAGSAHASCGCVCDEDVDCHDGAVCNLAAGHCIQPDGPCTSDDDCGGIQLCRAATGVCEDVCSECVVDADCDDGSFCNGAESCNRFRECEAGDPPCGDGIGCTIDGCNEDSDSCIHAPAHSQCDDGLYCNGVERCDPSAGCVDGEPADCGGEDFCGANVCDEETGGCVLVPQNDGLDCGAREPDTCTLSAVCATGACLVTPLCDEQCQRCDPEGCASLCGNPLGRGEDVVNSSDALFSLRAAVELEECSSCICDVNGDGEVTCVDTLMMLRHVVGLGDVFLCPATAGDTPTTTTTIP